MMFPAQGALRHAHWQLQGKEFRQNVEKNDDASALRAPPRPDGAGCDASHWQSGHRSWRQLLATEWLGRDERVGGRPRRGCN